MRETAGSQSNVRSFRTATIPVMGTLSPRSMARLASHSLKKKNKRRQKQEKKRIGEFQKLSTPSYLQAPTSVVNERSHQAGYVKRRVWGGTTLRNT